LPLGDKNEAKSSATDTKDFCENMRQNHQDFCEKNVPKLPDLDHI
jgi:hypothetical protein